MEAAVLGATTILTRTGNKGEAHDKCRSGHEAGGLMAPIGGVVRAFALLALASGTLGAAETRCANEIVDVTHSPNGRFKAVVFVRACSAPARFSTQVSVLKSKRPLSNVAGNVFMCDGSYGLSPSSSGRFRVSAAWNADDQLVVRYPSEAETLAAKQRFKGIRISYEPAEPLGCVGQDP